MYCPHYQSEILLLYIILRASKSAVVFCTLFHFTISTGIEFVWKRQQVKLLPNLKSISWNVIKFVSTQLFHYRWMVWNLRDWMCVHMCLVAFQRVFLRFLPFLLHSNYLLRVLFCMILLVTLIVRSRIWLQHFQHRQTFGNPQCSALHVLRCGQFWFSWRFTLKMFL